MRAHAALLVLACSLPAAAGGRRHGGALQSLSAQAQSLLGIPGVLSGKADGCFGLPKAECKPCPPGETNMCASTAARCTDTFCSPLCTSRAWTCDVAVKGRGAFAASVSPAERAALCAQVVGHACGGAFSCCAADAALGAWVRGHASDEFTGAPLLPLAGCVHDAANASAAKRACGACKGALRVKLRAAMRADDCRWGSPDMPSAKDKPAPAGYSLFSLEERCAALAKKLNAKLAALQKEVGQKLCQCAGCCDVPDGQDTCFFPMVDVTTSK